SSPTVFILVGCVFLLIGIVGGGVAIREVNVPRLDPVPRGASIATGIVLLLVGIWSQGSTAPPVDAAIKTQQAKVETSEAELADIRAQLAKLRQDQQTRENALAAESKKDTTEQVAKAREELDGLNKEIAALTQRQEQAHEQK